jgi:tetratricopeptide (TPR) repeat protein
MTRWIRILGAVFVPAVLLLPLPLPADPADHGLADRHAAQAKALFDEGFYRLLPRQSRAEAQAKFDLAVGENRRAIQLDPDHETAYRQLARVYRVQKRFDEEIDMQREILRLRPFDIDVRVHLADALTRLGRYPEALAELRAARGHTDDPHALGLLDRYIGLVEQRL